MVPMYCTDWLTRTTFTSIKNVWIIHSTMFVKWWGKVLFIQTIFCWYMTRLILHPMVWTEKTWFVMIARTGDQHSKLHFRRSSIASKISWLEPMKCLVIQIQLASWSSWKSHGIMSRFTAVEKHHWLSRLGMLDLWATSLEYGVTGSE